MSWPGAAQTCCTGGAHACREAAELAPHHTTLPNPAQHDIRLALACRLAGSAERSRCCDAGEGVLDTDVSAADSPPLRGMLAAASSTSLRSISSSITLDSSRCSACSSWDPATSSLDAVAELLPGCLPAAGWPAPAPGSASEPVMSMLTAGLQAALGLGLMRARAEAKGLAAVGRPITALMSTGPLPLPPLLLPRRCSSGTDSWSKGEVTGPSGALPSIPRFMPLPGQSELWKGDGSSAVPAEVPLLRALLAASAEDAASSTAARARRRRRHTSHAAAVVASATTTQAVAMPATAPPDRPSDVLAASCCLK